MRIKYTLLILTALLAAGLVSCKKEEAEFSQENADKALPSQITVTHTKLYKMRDYKQQYYYDSENRLTRIITTYYTGKYDDKEKPGTVIYTEYKSLDYDQQGRLIRDRTSKIYSEGSGSNSMRSTEFIHDGNTITVLYSGNEQLKSIIELDANNRMTEYYEHYLGSPYLYSYSENGNIVRVNQKDATISLRYKYEYDLKYGINKNVNTPQWYFILFGEFYCKNNICNNQTTESYFSIWGREAISTFRYKYNSIRFPVSISESMENKGTIRNTKIRYIKGN